jgi:DNA-binding MarR family transcriptional regulator
VYRLRDRDRACYGRVTANECHALAALTDADGLSVDGLAEQLGLHKSNASRLAAGLARRGLVRREADASDGRGLRLRATAQGRATLVAIRTRIEARQATVLAAHAPPTRRALIALLKALTAEAAVRLGSPLVRSPGARKRSSC